MKYKVGQIMKAIRNIDKKDFWGWRNFAIITKIEKDYAILTFVHPKNNDGTCWRLKKKDIKDWYKILR